MKKYVVYFWEGNNERYIERFIPQVYKLQSTSRIEDAKVYEFANDGEVKAFMKGLREVSGLVFSAEELETANA